MSLFRNAGYQCARLAVFTSLLAASALAAQAQVVFSPPKNISNSSGNAQAQQIAVDANGSDLAGPITGSVNGCVFSCTWVTFYNNTVNLSSFAKYRCKRFAIQSSCGSHRANKRRSRLRKNFK